MKFPLSPCYKHQMKEYLLLEFPDELWILYQIPRTKLIICTFFFFFFPYHTITGCFSRLFFSLLSLFFFFYCFFLHFLHLFLCFPFFPFCKYISLIFLFFLVVFFASFTFLQFSDFHFPNTFLSPLLSSLIYHIRLN